MRWSVFIVALILVAALDAALMPLFELGGATPLALASLASFVCLFAPRGAVLVSMVCIGLLLDLRSPEAFAGGTLHVLGPWALGFAFGSSLILPIRASLMRRNPLTVAVTTVAILLAASLVWTAVWSIRSWYPGSLAPWGDGSALGSLWHAVRWAAWSGAAALPLGWLLLRTLPAWGLSGGSTRSRR